MSIDIVPLSGAHADQNSPWVTSNVTHKTWPKNRIGKVWKHTRLPFQFNVKVNKHPGSGAFSNIEAGEIPVVKMF